MKNVLLSADGEIGVFAVPDEVADNLEEFCMEFCGSWLHNSPDAAKYRVRMGGMTVARYTEYDFIEYLNRYLHKEPSFLVTSLAGVYEEEKIPKEYAGAPYFNF